MINPFLVGKNLYLRAHIHSDIDSNWHQWFNDSSVTKYMYKGVFPNTQEDQAAFLDEILSPSSKNNHLQLAILENETDRLIGVISLGKIDWVNRTAEIAIVIGQKDARSKHHGLEAMALCIDHGFAKMNLNRIYAGQHIGLKPWKEALVEKLGFVHEGTMREAIFSQGRYHNVVIISVLASDWFRLMKEVTGFENLYATFS
jgi:[ribosomal protein S5]-alanine N-acetyltransferase